MLILAAGLAGSLALHYRRAPGSGSPGELEALRNQLAAEQAKVAAESSRRADETAQLRRERDAALANASALEQDRAASAASKQAAEETLAKTRQAYDELEKRMREAFASAAQAQLSANREQFLGMAEQKFAPFRNQLDELNKANSELKGSIKTTAEQSSAIAAEARRLANAMTSTNRQGAWGELQLKRVVELTGMTNCVDFDTQVSVDTPDGQLRPDMVVTLPGGKKIVIDAKAPTKAFIEMSQATSEAERARLAAQLVEKIRLHAQQLGSKRYMDHFKPSPEFVVLFLPSEALFATALTQDPTLIELAWDSKVIIATPTTLLAMLRSIAHSWQHVEVEGAALKVIDAAGKVYEGVRHFAENYAEIGDCLNRASDSYNTGLGHLQSRVLGNAKRLLQKGEELRKDPIPTIDSLSTRALIAGELQDRTPRKPKAADTQGAQADPEAGEDPA